MGKHWAKWVNLRHFLCRITKIVSEHDQEIPQSQTTDNPVTPRGRAAQPGIQKTCFAQKRTILSVTEQVILAFSDVLVAFPYFDICH